MNNSGKIVQLLNPTNNQDAATKSYVDTSIPIGGIIMWSGAGVTLPSNWKLCDGTTYGSVVTPDLRGRFVLSSGQGSGLTNRTTGQTGGEQTVALAETHMPSHSHGVSARTGGSDGIATDGAHAHTINDPGHQHYLIEGMGIVYAGSSWYARDGGFGGPNPRTNKEVTGITITSNNRAYNQWPNYDTTGTYHNHTITVSETAKGSGTAHENMPPFYVLAFIMRVS